MPRSKTGRVRPTHDRERGKHDILALLREGKQLNEVSSDIRIGRATIWRWTQSDEVFSNEFQEAQIAGARMARAAVGSHDERAYVAGFFDGEGCIRLQRGAVQKTGMRYYFPVVFLGNTNRSIIEFIHGLWPGNTRTDTRNARNANARPLHQWHRSGVGAEVFLRDIGPFLRVKRAQADLVSEFLLFAGDRRRRHEYTAEYDAHMIDFYVRMTRLNHRGVEPKQARTD